VIGRARSPSEPRRDRDITPYQQIDLDLFSDSINGSHAMIDAPEIQTKRRLDEFSIRFGKEILWARPELHASILAALVNAQEAHLREPTISKAEHLRREFAAEGWLKGGASEPRFSFLRERVAVQIRFSDRALLRFLYAFKADQIDVGVLIVDSKSQMSRAASDLLWLRSTLTVPLWVIALK
jgi:hypothetical protein